MIEFLTGKEVSDPIDSLPWIQCLAPFIQEIIESPTISKIHDQVNSFGGLKHCPRVVFVGEVAITAHIYHHSDTTDVFVLYCVEDLLLGLNLLSHFMGSLVRFGPKVHYFYREFRIL